MPQAAKTLARVGFFSPHAAAGIEPLLRKRVDSFRQSEIELGEPALAVGGKNQAHLVIANVDIGMVLLILGVAVGL